MVTYCNKDFIIGPTEVECEDRTGDNAATVAMICVPDYLDEQQLHQAKIDSLGRIDHSIVLQTIPGGMFAQILHEGLYDDIKQTKAKLDDQIRSNGYVSVGTYTEIIMTPMFFNNRCKIIIRQRIEPAA